jgi:hypothetical protein
VVLTHIGDPSCSRGYRSLLVPDRKAGQPRMPGWSHYSHQSCTDNLCQSFNTSLTLTARVFQRRRANRAGIFTGPGRMGLHASRASGDLLRQHTSGVLKRSLSQGAQGDLGARQAKTSASGRVPRTGTASEGGEPELGRGAFLAGLLEHLK